jgi:hypothetical protein
MLPFFNVLAIRVKRVASQFDRRKRPRHYIKGLLDEQLGRSHNYTHQTLVAAGGNPGAVWAERHCVYCAVVV